MTIIVMSTLDPDTMNELGQRVENHSDVQLIAAAVSGGATGAQDGTLSIMASGPEERVASVRPYLDAVGSNVFYYGRDPGNSQAAKLVNNLILGITMNAVAEGLKFGALYNLPQDELLDLFRVSTGDSWVARN
jgi:3-hydroxyisobutyrate dehydrogenase